MRRTAIVVAASVLLTGCLEWSQPGGDAGRTGTVVEDRLTTATIGQLVERWVAPVAPGLVLTWEDRVVVPRADGVDGIDTATGAVVWSAPGANRGGSIRDGVLLTAHFTSSSSCGGSGCSTSSEGRRRAYSTADGAPRPELDRTWSPNSGTGPASAFVTADVTVEPVQHFDYDSVGTGYATYWFEVDGRQVTPTLDPYGAMGALDDLTDHLFVSLFGNQASLRAYDLSGNLLWQRDDVPGLGGPQVGGGQVYTGYEVADAATGERQWGLADVLVAQRAFRSGSAYVRDQAGLLQVFQDCGEDQCAAAWTAATPTGDDPTGAVAVAGDVVLVAGRLASGETALQAYPAAGCGAATCVPLVDVEVTGTFSGGLAVARGQVYVSTSTGLHAFGLP